MHVLCTSLNFRAPHAMYSAMEGIVDYTNLRLLLLKNLLKKLAKTNKTIIFIYRFKIKAEKETLSEKTIIILIFSSTTTQASDLTVVASGGSIECPNHFHGNGLLQATGDVTIGRLQGLNFHVISEEAGKKYILVI